LKFIESVQHGFTHYADFKGRASRSQFWWWTLFSTAAGTLGEFIGDNLFDGSVGTAANIVVTLALVIPGSAVTARRLQDTNRSGWLQVIGATIVGLIPLFFWTISEGTLGPNRFGPDPLAVDTGPGFWLKKKA
jgi:uncharacterized membrane protein YhaH (DUF805 family)